MLGKGSRCSYSKFCPEVTYSTFGWFASGLYRHLDDVDTETAHQRLSNAMVPTNDWRWYWDDLNPMHYAECPLYSMLDYMTIHSEASLTDKAIQNLKNNPRIYKVAVAGIVVIAIGAAVSGLRTILAAVIAVWSYFWCKT